MEQHLVSGKLLFRHIFPVENNNGHTQEKVEVVGLVVCPAGLPHAQSLRVGELSFEAEQDPAMAEEQLEAVLPQPGEVLVEAGQHETQQLPQVHQLPLHVFIPR